MEQLLLDMILAGPMPNLGAGGRQRLMLAPRRTCDAGLRGWPVICRRKAGAQPTAMIVVKAIGKPRPPQGTLAIKAAKGSK